MVHPTKQFSASTPSQVKSPFPFSRTKIPGRQAIALISEPGDPAAETRKEETGGQNVYVRQVGESLAKLGWQVDMFTRKTNSTDPAIVQHSPHCRTIRLVAGPEEFVPRDELFQYMPEFVEAFRKFQTKESANYPLIHTNYWLSGWVGLQLKQFTNFQLIHTYHSLGAVKYQATGCYPAVAPTRLTVEKQLMEEATCVVVISPQEEEKLRSLVSSQGCVEVIPGAVDLNTFHSIPKTEARAKLGLNSEHQIVLYVGRFDPRKGMETLVRAFAQLKQEAGYEVSGANETPLLPTPPSLLSSNLRLVIVGGGDLEETDIQEQRRIQRLVQELGLAEQTIFAGRMGHDILPLYYTAADVCVIPSQYEPFGLVAIEAMACGTPVVASDIGGLKFTVIPGETGLLVPSQDVTAFTEAIARILNDKVWAMKLKKQASTRVQQNFSWTGSAVRLSDLYRRLLAQSLTQEPLVRAQVPAQEAIARPITRPAAAVNLTKVS
jgi:glycosyltransferase involved in cell wall biosynthesis